jgi:hypothetical protein
MLAGSEIARIVDTVTGYSAAFTPADFARER